MWKNGLIRKIKLISKFVTSQPGSQTIAIHILMNISRIKRNQAMRNIFLEKSYTKCGGETIARPFSKKTKLSISLDQQSKVLYSFFLLYAKLRPIAICGN